jgi:hypothetical protein
MRNRMVDRRELEVPSGGEGYVVHECVDPSLYVGMAMPVRALRIGFGGNDGKEEGVQEG